MDIRSYWENTFRRFREEWSGDLPIRSALESGSQAVEALCRLLPPGGRLLDFGCGPGRNALAFAERGFAVDVCDISDEAVRLCLDLARKVDAPIGAVPLDEHHVKVPSHTYDGVLALAVLDHVTFEMAMALAVEFNRILKPGGLALLTLDPLSGDDGNADEPNEVLMDGTLRFTGGPQSGLLYRRYGNREVMDLFSIGWEPLVFLAADPGRPRDFLFRCDKRRGGAAR